MSTYFFYGTLRHPPLLNVVLGRDVATTPARLEGHAVRWVEGAAFPMILEEPGATAPGVVATGLGPQDVARLDYYEGGFAYDTRVLTVEATADPLPACVYFPTTADWQPGALWHLADWIADWGDVTVEAARDFLRLRGQTPAVDVLARYDAMLIRAASRVRARQEKPSDLRRDAGEGDVLVGAYRQPYAGFFALEEYDLQFRRFDGGMSERVNRTAFVSGDAAVVLPYDPVRDRVMLVEQFRAGPFARGDSQPWMLEPVAGRIDPDETPEDAARREAKEEAGLTLGALHAAPACYPSPGAVTEYLYHFIGIADLPDGITGIGGVAEEAEDIRSHLIGYHDLMALVESGEADNAPLILLALWLARTREGLRAAAGA